MGFDDPRTYFRRVFVRVHIDDNDRRLHFEFVRCQITVHVRRDRKYDLSFLVSRGGVGSHGIVFRVPCHPRNVFSKTYFARVTIKYIIVLRYTTFQGLTVGPFFHLFSAWASEEEASTLLSFSFSGYSFGTILSYPFSGIFCSTNIYGYGGWPLIYYIPGKIIYYGTIIKIIFEYNILLLISL